MRQAFPDAPSEGFWSSSVVENGDPDLAWQVDFDSGHTSYSNGRCRGIPANAERILLVIFACGERPRARLGHLLRQRQYVPFRHDDEQERALRSPRV